MVKPRSLSLPSAHGEKDPALLARAIALSAQWGPSSPSEAPRLNTVCNPVYAQDAEWKECLQATTPPESWQHAHILYGLRQLGCVNPGTRGLGVACAHETLLYRLAGLVDSVCGIDICDDRSGYEDKEMLSDPARFAPFEYPKEKLTVSRWKAGEAFPFEAQRFDFAWSVSSLEHFGSWKNKAATLQESARVLKPGGILAFTTELIVSQQRFRGIPKLSKLRFEKEYFTKSDLEQLLQVAPELHLVEPVHWAASEGTLRSPLTQCIHGFLYLPIALFLRKETSATVCSAPDCS